ncbi:MAG TPA: exodeoxyribonuclease VII large subunit [Pyrinomonadaceae bacterium]|jgi:exodeoxyribonuclease VII large subunit|nr:exodeoxyribonuclease VII large subunit [Pyrinomonadaceae bacterium]
MNEPLFQALFQEEERRPLTVTELNAEVRETLEGHFSQVWVEGEVVDFKQVGQKGHWYFNLNDGSAAVKCVCWGGTNFRIKFRPQNGMTVRIRGRLTFWEQRGELKLTVDSLEPAGEGALRAAFEQIKMRLDAEGLFAQELKRPLPFFPRRIGVVTSQTGAAFHDIIYVLTRRARSINVLLAPALVQGEGAADSIRRAIIGLNKYNRSLDHSERLDVLIIGRGGGSAEDLWAFNDEALARAIRASEIPIISAVGHEIDWTISDLVADERAATPSAAAEMVAAREEDICTAFAGYEGRLTAMMSHRTSDLAYQMETLETTLERSFAATMQLARSRFENASTRLSPGVLQQRFVAGGNRLESLSTRSRTAISRLLSRKGEAFGVAVAKLNVLSPLAVLTRGYSITETADGKVLRDSALVKKGDKLKIRLGRGKLDAEVLSSE